MRRTGVGVQALRPLRGRAAPEPGPRHRPDALKRPPKKIQKKRRGGANRGLDVTGATDKQGSRLVRWAAVEAVQRVPAHTGLGQVRDQVGARRGRNIGVVAAARELIVLVFYGLRDHHLRCLPARPRAA
jgi:hypothetical protein